MKVLVCGGRDYTDAPRLFAVLNKLHDAFCIDTIIEGGAKGADALAKHWAYMAKIKSVTVQANWLIYGQVAGPIRNRQMLELNPDLVIAFPGGKGTANMIKQATKRGFRVIDMGVKGLSGSDIVNDLQNLQRTEEAAQEYDEIQKMIDTYAGLQSENSAPEKSTEALNKRAARQGG